MTTPATAAPMKIEVALPDFFKADPKKLTVETPANTGRIYFLDKKGRLLAVARPLEPVAS